MIPYLRIYELSIINYIKYEVLPLQYLELISDEPLVLDTVNGGYKTQTDMEPNPTSPGRGWAVFDEATVNSNLVIDTSAEQTTMVTVNGASSYTVDYLNGRIVNPNTVPSSVSFYWNYISVVESWPGVDPPPLPIVVVDMETKLGVGFQLGGGTKDVLRGTIYIFATSELEKKDITDLIHNKLENRSLVINNWHQGGYLKYDGTYNNLFSKTVVESAKSGVFTEVVSNLSGPRLDWSEVNRHRSKINFTLEVNRE